ncbi:hypothetical protein BJ993_001279 [Nocardioides aromaticivorans]|uniref:Carboxypeptidase regulatory-like domain-containing protein n=1 Tax=Nocardioides aromaticivorans TaxID=200618 RepID=A0A7Y9ZEZ3_9ACTN|nr:hypothetical protein [Nocardioides aromaticivorans]NYI44199.1 hypothetical protein [Nocardioides aromaticivorans]
MSVPSGYDVRAVRVIVRSATDPALVATDEADADGSFEVDGLAAGDYSIVFGTYFAGMVCNGSNWPSGAGDEPVDECTVGELHDGGTVSVVGGQTTTAAPRALLGDLALYPFQGRVAAPAGHTTAGVVAELWAYDGGDWGIPQGWSRLTSVPVQVLDADGVFRFDLIAPPWLHQYAVRFVDAPGNGYALSFDNMRSWGAELRPGAIGVLAFELGSQGADVGTHTFGFAVDRVGGGVSISGPAVWGGTLTAHSDVVWSDPSAGTDFQWYVDGVPIEGATGATYTIETWPVVASHAYSVRAVPGPGSVYDGTPVESASVWSHAGTPIPVGAPVVTGTATVGRTLAATAGAWSPSLVYAHTYQWTRSGQDIVGATSPTYVVRPADVGHRLRVVVGAAFVYDCADCPQPFTGPGSSASPATAVVAPGTIVSSWIARWPVRLEPSTPRVRRWIGVSAPRYSAAGTAHHLRAAYRWYVGGRVVAGATGRRLFLKRAWRGRSVAVRVTISAAGYRPTYRTTSFGRIR